MSRISRFRIRLSQDASFLRVTLHTNTPTKRKTLPVSGWWKLLLLKGLLAGEIYPSLMPTGVQADVMSAWLINSGHESRFGEGGVITAGGNFLFAHNRRLIKGSRLFSF